MKRSPAYNAWLRSIGELYQVGPSAHSPKTVWIRHPALPLVPRAVRLGTAVIEAIGFQHGLKQVGAVWRTVVLQDLPKGDSQSLEAEKRPLEEGPVLHFLIRQYPYVGDPQAFLAASIQ